MLSTGLHSGTLLPLNWVARPGQSAGLRTTTVQFSAKTTSTRRSSSSQGYLDRLYYIECYAPDKDLWSRLTRNSGLLTIQEPMLQWSSKEQFFNIYVCCDLAVRLLYMKTDLYICHVLINMFLFLLCTHTINVSASWRITVSAAYIVAVQKRQIRCPVQQW